MLKDSGEAYDLLKALGAAGRLLRHAELSIIDEIAQRLGVSRWDVFELDTAFEEIAAGGAERLEASRPYEFGRSRSG